MTIQISPAPVAFPAALADETPRALGRRALVVLGMHRSGTSALARVLSLCGAALPEHLLPAHDGLASDGNSRAGFWESKQLMLLHEEALAAAGSRWDDVRDLAPSWFESEDARRFTRRLVEALETEFLGAGLFVAKDPRISRLVPLWLAALRRIGVEAHWLICVRNPLEIAASLARRDGLSSSQSFLVWLRYFLEAERSTRGQARLFVPFDDLLDDWRGVIQRVERRFDFAFPNPRSRVAADVEGFLDRELRHHTSPPEAICERDDISSWVQLVFAWGTAAAVQDPGSEVLDEVSRQLRAAEAAFGPLLSAAEKRWQLADGRRTELAREVEALYGAVHDDRGADDGVRPPPPPALEHWQADLRERLAIPLDEAPDEASPGAAGAPAELRRLTSSLASLEERLKALERRRATAAQAQPSSRVKAIAFYLPQYHPIPENDTWWGKGFTEWSNVTRAEPLFSGHAQPLLPSELGFYDLRLPEVRRQQAELAREHGIHGFCYYYYWFRGRKLLERPLEEMLASGEPDFPFCLCWANENWTRRWDGEDQEILLAQDHSPESDARFIDDVLPALLDPRYILRNGEPVLLVYRPDLLAQPIETAARWREAARRAGLPGLHLCGVWLSDDPRKIGFDALVEFPPHHFVHEPLREPPAEQVAGFRGLLYDYAAGVAAVRPLGQTAFPIHRGVMPAWDNTARRGAAAVVFVGSTPEKYGEWLEKVACEAVTKPGNDDQFVFVNAWNEWAEGATLEPSRQLGRGLLEATRAALDAAADERADLRRLEGRVLGELLKVQDDLGSRQAQQQVALDWLRQLTLTHRDALSWLGEQPARLAASVSQLAAETHRDRAGLEALGRAVTGTAAEGLEELRRLTARVEAHSHRRLLWDRDFGLLAFVVKLPLWIARGRRRQSHAWWREGRRLLRSGLFDPSFYCRRYADVEGTGIRPLVHYVRFGMAEGRAPNVLADRAAPPAPATVATGTGATGTGATGTVAAGWTLEPRQLAKRGGGTRPLLFVSHDAARAGSQIYLREVLRSFAELPDREVYLILRRGGELAAELATLAHVIELAAWPGGETAVLDAALAAIAPRPELAVCNTVASGTVARALAERGIPVVSIVHELPTTIEALGVETVRDVLQASAAVIAVSDFVRAALVSRYQAPPEKLRVVYAGVPGWRPETESPEEARRRIVARHALPADAVLVLGCGTVHHRKGTDLFVQVAAKLVHDFGLADVRFVWVGGDEDGPLFRGWCEHDVARLGLADRVIFAGTQAETADYFLSARAFLLTSREDPFPLVNLEALARGVPVVAFDGAGGAVEALGDGGGILVPYLDTTEMARALVQLLEAPRHHAEASQRALARAQERFRWERFVGELREVMSAHAAPPEVAS